MLPSRISKRVRIENPYDVPCTNSGAKIFDYDQNGEIIDIYLENERTKVYIIKASN